MAVERRPGDASLIDVLDRVLDKGIVIDAWVLASRAGIDLTTANDRVIVASGGTPASSLDTSVSPGDIPDARAAAAASAPAASPAVAAGPITSGMRARPRRRASER